jgi:hypothetical protein
MRTFTPIVKNGKENICYPEISINKIENSELKYFQFMEITEAYCTNTHRGIVAKKWKWVTFENKSEVLELIEKNINILKKGN